MEVRLDHRKLTGTVKVIQSKSFAHRILLAAALSKITSGLETEVKLETVSEDMEATRRVIAAMERGEDVLDCGESGTTLRFVVPVCGALREEGRRQKRPEERDVEKRRPVRPARSGSPAAAGSCSGPWDRCLKRWLPTA